MKGDSIIKIMEMKKEEKIIEKLKYKRYISIYNV